MKLEFTNWASNAHIQLPASKSISNRALIINALTNNNCELQNLSVSSDTQVLLEMLASPLMIVNANDCGTAYRFITAYLATRTSGRSKIVTGSPHLRTRPIADLVEALQNIGAKITYMDLQNFAPIKIEPTTITENKIQVDGSKSSQFVSALCLVAPYCANGLEIEITGDKNSEPYIDMTLQLMQQFGVTHTKMQNKIIIANGNYTAQKYFIENDWSSACFFYSALMLAETPQSIVLQNMQLQSIQGDKHMAVLAQDFGISSTQINNDIVLQNNGTLNIKGNYNLSNYPDLAIPFIVACALQFPQVSISGLTTLAHKESNRIEALKAELLKTGITLHYENDLLQFSGQFDRAIPDLKFHTYADHRIAMALALVSLKHKTVCIENPEVVAKSFPNYWSEFAKLGGRV